MSESTQLIDLLNDLEDAQKAKKVCPVVRLAEGLDEATAERLLRLVENSNLTLSSLWSALHSAGYQIGRESLGLHRANKCVCFREVRVDS